MQTGCRALATSAGKLSMSRCLGIQPKTAQADSRPPPFYSFWLKSTSTDSPGGISSIRTLALVRLRHLQRATKRYREAYDTWQSSSRNNSWMRVSCSRSPVSYRWIWSAHGVRNSSLGVSTCRGPDCPMAASRLSCPSLSSVPSQDEPSATSAVMYLATVPRTAPSPRRCVSGCVLPASD